MSLGIIVKCPEGLVLAAESRVTITAKSSNGPVVNNFDNAKKVLTFSGHHKHIGAITYGLGSLKLRTAQSFMPEFESTLPDERLSVEDFAIRLGKFFMKQWEIEKLPDPKTYKQGPMHFLVAGYDEGEPYGKAFEIAIPVSIKPKSIKKENEFGLNWGGQREIVDRLMNGYDPRILNIIKSKLAVNDKQMDFLTQHLRSLQMQIPVQMMALQDCINLATFMLKTTISAQEHSIGIRGCGGNIDVAVITRTDGIQFIKQKKLQVQ